jgi:hypothetical protein
MTDLDVKKEARKLGDFVLRGVSVLGATGVLLGGIVLLSRPDNLLEDSAVWQIPYVGQSLKWFWEYPYEIGKFKITNQRLVGSGLTLIGLNYFKVPHFAAWLVGQIPPLEPLAQKALAGYLSVFEFVENIFIPRLSVPDAIFRTKEWQNQYKDFYKSYTQMQNDAKQVVTADLKGVFIPTGA